MTYDSFTASPIITGEFGSYCYSNDGMLCDLNYGLSCDESTGYRCTTSDGIDL